MSPKGKPNGKKSGAPPNTRSTRAGLVFPVGRTHRQLRNGRYAKRVSPGAAVYMASSLEYLTSEILELAGSRAKKNNRTCIMPKHIAMAVEKDVEMKTLLGGIYIEGGTLDIELDARALPTRARKNLEKREKKRLADAMEVVHADAVAEEAPSKKKKKKKENSAKAPVEKKKTKKAEVMDVDEEEAFVSAAEEESGKVEDGAAEEPDSGEMSSFEL